MRDRNMSLSHSSCPSSSWDEVASHNANDKEEHNLNVSCAKSCKFLATCSALRRRKKRSKNGNKNGLCCLTQLSDRTIVAAQIPGGSSLISQSRSCPFSKGKYDQPIQQRERLLSTTLPILRHCFTAQDIKISLGERNIFDTFTKASFKLETGEFPRLWIRPTLSKHKLTAGLKDKNCFQISFMSPYATSVSHSNCRAKELRIANMSARSEDTCNTDTCINIRFEDEAEALKWKQLFDMVLQIAFWLQQLQPTHKISKHSRQSKVWSVQSIVTKEEFVIKQVQNSCIDSIMDTEKLPVGSSFGNEIAILKRLYPIAVEHSDVSILEAITKYRVIETSSAVCLIMPKYPGSTLAEFMRSSINSGSDSTMGEKDAANVLKKLLEFLTVLHDSNIVHCDIKLENIMINDNGRCVRLIDFGAAVDCSLRLQTHKLVIGTPGYMAPERFHDPPIPLTPAADVFSLGIVLYQILVGTHPYKSTQCHADGTLSVSASQHLDWEYASTSMQQRGISSSVQNLLSRMLLADSIKRITVSELRRHPWLSL
uniref:Protein kinase domain containing protein putative n=1 Tax=Albugo laibachii Nc14 TaxID=890382 RepID=F0WJ80_9STRA|nr:Protein kinase domain containing protein putative [Albugo laibachii Nc14]|eukprot:CCA21327.1 Protein kinase domain containing protein putative [Albugo laibachii Nc14]